MFVFRPLILAITCLMLILNQLSGVHLHLAHQADAHAGPANAGNHHHAHAHAHAHATAHVVVDIDEHHLLGHNIDGHADIESDQAGISKTPNMPMLALVAAVLLALLWRSRSRPPAASSGQQRPWQPRLLIPPAQAPPVTF